MSLVNTISLPHEPWLEKWARYFRYQRALPALSHYLASKKGQITIVDYGCGQDVLFYKYLRLKFPEAIKRITYIGIDPLITPTRKTHFYLIRSKFETAKLATKADVAVMFAVLEHVDDPTQLLQSALNLLKPQGKIIATTPSWAAKPVLEFFSYVLGVIAPREIDEHQRYFSKTSVEKIFAQLRRQFAFRQATHTYFEFYLNNYLEITKQ